jgi:hypothetical protein
MGEDVEFPVNGEIPPAISDGEDYQLIFLRAESGGYRGRLKVYLRFQMISPGESFGQEFYMACNVAPKGKWTASYKFWEAWVLAAGKRPTRTDRMSTAIFRNKVFRARMRMVRKKANQTDRTPAQRYSVVDELLEVMVGR